MPWAQLVSATLNNNKFLSDSVSTVEKNVHRVTIQVESEGYNNEAVAALVKWYLCPLPSSWQL